jgi:hypothetical protein
MQPAATHTAAEEEVIMKRRLYFLLPDREHTQTVVDELETSGIERRQMHVLAAQDIDLQGLPVATHNQRKDLGARLETLLWDGNLVLFFIALVVLSLLALMHVNWPWLLLPAAVMLATFLTGLGFTRHIPNVHLSEFSDAIHHGELLLMVDVPVRQIRKVQDLVHRHHPEAVVGGVGWHADALHT